MSTYLLDISVAYLFLMSQISPDGIPEPDMPEGVLSLKPLQQEHQHFTTSFGYPVEEEDIPVLVILDVTWVVWGHI